MGVFCSGCCEPDVHTQMVARFGPFPQEKLTLRPFVAHWILSMSFL